MQETLKMMKGIITGKEIEKDEKELIKQYKESLLPNILAYFYCNNFRLIYITSESYKIISTEDKASFCLQELDKCLQNYDLRSNAKFMTYFIRCLKNRLRTETEILMHNNNRANIFINDLDELSNSLSYDDYTDIDLLLNNYRLNQNEKKYCKLINHGYSIKEMSKIMKVSTISLYKWQKNIRKKILNEVINFA